MDIKQTLLNICSVDAVSGRESSLLSVIQKLTAGIPGFAGFASADKSGNIIIFPQTVGDNGKPLLILEAHADQIGLIVTEIEDGGFLRVSSIGGMDRRGLSAKPVTVHGRRDVKGIVTSIPPHLQKDDSAAKVNPKIEDIFIDIGEPGRCKNSVREFISPGDFVTYDFCAAELLNETISCKSLDNRAGVAAILKTLELLYDKNNSSKNFKYNICAVFTAQEELGCRGALTAAWNTNPDLAIVVDVSWALTPDSKPYKCGKTGKGPMIGTAPSLDCELTRQLCSAALEADITYQMEPVGGKTGTNADFISMSRTGIRTGLVSIPLKYMHTPAETTALADIEKTAQLLAQFIRPGI